MCVGCAALNLSPVDLPEIHTETELPFRSRMVCVTFFLDTIFFHTVESDLDHGGTSSWFWRCRPTKQRQVLSSDRQATPF